MTILGVDVGFRNFGYCLTRVNGKAEVIQKGTINLGPTKEWRRLIPLALNHLRGDIAGYIPDLVSIEELVWYGKRKGVLGLAHLAGAVAGWGTSLGSSVVFFQPREVKAATQRGRFPKNFTEHEKDSLSLCRLALDRYETELAHAKKPTRRPSR